MAGGLRFAMVTTFYPPYHFGGDGSAVRRLAHALARRGHRVDIIHDIDAFRMLGDRADREPLSEPEGVRVHGLRSPLGLISCVATQQTGRPLVHGRRIRTILREGFDVIHFHNISLVGGPAVFSCGSGIKLYTAHEHWLVCPTHVLWRHKREVCTGRECLRCVMRYRRPPQIWRSTSLLRRQSEHVDAFLTLSDFSAQKHAEFGFDRPLTVIPPFLLDAEADIASEALPVLGAHVPPYFLFVGRLELIKGLQDVIPLFAGDGETEIWIAGSGSYESRLRQLAGSGRRVRFLGQQPADRLRRLYRDAIALVVPSVSYEVFPTVVLEAFREGTPIVARHLGPLPEIVERSGGGLLFTTPDDLQRSLSSLAADRHLRDNLGQAAERAFKAHWSETVAIEKYLDVIRDIARLRRLDRVLQRV